MNIVNLVLLSQATVSVDVGLLVERFRLIHAHAVRGTFLIRMQILLSMPACSVPELITVVVATSVILMVLALVQGHLLVEILFSNFEPRI